MVLAIDVWIACRLLGLRTGSTTRVRFMLGLVSRRVSSVTAALNLSGGPAPSPADTPIRRPAGRSRVQHGSLARTPTAAMAGGYSD
jgi:hypothetical protein